MTFWQDRYRGEQLDSQLEGSSTDARVQWSTVSPK